MHRPLSILAQAILSIVLVAGAYGVWSERDRLAVLAGFGPAGAEIGAGTAAGGQGRSEDPAPVMVAPVDLAGDDVVLTAVGTGRARRSVELRTEAAGRIDGLALAAGRRFDEGDVLLRLDDRAQQLAVELARARLDEAERVLERYATLQGRGAASEAALTEARTAREVARIAVEQAEDELADRTLTAPFAGVSGIPEVEVGQRIDGDTKVGTLDDRFEILVEFDLPEIWLPRVAAGMEVHAETPAAAGGSASGTVSAIDSRVDPVSRTARVRVTLPNGDDRLRPGASFVLRLDLEGGRYPRVPELSFRFSQGQGHVWRIRDGLAERVDVTLVRRVAGAVLVDGDLAAGDEVVVEGAQRLREGRAVEVLGASGIAMRGGAG